jgi:hypothetical protein
VGQSFGVTISNCYATGIVSGDRNVGGLVGANSSLAKFDGSWLSGRIAYCYSTGSVTGTTGVGGLVGWNSQGGVISTSFWDIQTGSRSNMCGRQTQGTGCDNRNGKSTAEMQTEITFLDAGWDFVSESVNGSEDIWSICEGLDYPKLASQFLIGDFDGDSRVDLADFAFVAERWLSSDRRFFWCRGADINGDGKVGVADLEKFADNWLAEGIPRLRGELYLVVDDFESYNDRDPSDAESNRIFNAWIDGYDNPTINGAIVGHITRPFVERQIVHSGGQSMPYSYDTLFKFAIAELTLDPPQNWAVENAAVLSLWFHGDSTNVSAAMGVMLNDGPIVYHDNPDAASIDTWTEWIIDLQVFTGIDMANVSSIAICFGDQGNLQPGGSGIVYFDDIRVYGPG